MWTQDLNNLNIFWVSVGVTHNPLLPQFQIGAVLKSSMSWLSCTWVGIHFQRLLNITGGWGRGGVADAIC